MTFKAPTRTATAVTPAQLAAGLLLAPASVGQTRLVALDGHSGSGKSWLADLLAAQLNAPLIHMDDLYDGWDGMPDAVAKVIEWIITPLSRRRPARWRRFDWDEMAYAEWHMAEPGRIVLLEGCASIRPAIAAAYSTRIWVQAPAATRRRRLHAREDWGMYEPFAARWAEQELALYRSEDTARLCDLVVENSGDSSHDEPSLDVWPQGTDTDDAGSAGWMRTRRTGLIPTHPTGPCQS